MAGATANQYKDYLKQIGKVPLNAEEVELAKQIEAAPVLGGSSPGGKITPRSSGTSSGSRRTAGRADRLLEANLVYVVCARQALHRCRGMLFLDLIRRATSA